ncbi:hypothetical protein MNBD_GAMMA15-2555, partial [hydrothermal vent metagenome]
MSEPGSVSGNKGSMVAATLAAIGASLCCI